MVHDTKAWRTSSEKSEKEAEKENLRGDSLAEQLEAKEKELAEAFARIVHLEESKENIVDEYLESEEYREILAAHDDSFYAVPYSHGWEGASKAGDSRHLSMFSFFDFPCPENPQFPSQQLVEHSLFGGERILDPDNVPLETPDEVHEGAGDDAVKEDDHEGSSDSSSSCSEDD